MASKYKHASERELRNDTFEHLTSAGSQDEPKTLHILHEN
eukprot:COSAG06_NODE_37960_length_429_cov_0.712121_1_plen_39_part_10